MLKSNIKFYSLKDKNPVSKLASIMIRDLNEGICILPGGKTPIDIYKRVSSSMKVKNNRLVLLSDDRLVSVSDEKSNFGMLKKNLNIKFNKNFPINYHYQISNFGFHSIENLFLKFLSKKKIKCSYLGLGEDSHTASLFPNNPKILEDDNFGIILKNPGETYSRFSLSFNTLMLAEKIIFIVLGENKINALNNIMSDHIDYLKYPAQKIIKEHHNVEIYTDIDNLKFHFL
tara:strand:- start:2342 stop:3031 length:690 start_codon:yes stop_codon:yes gene_type:complete